MTVQEMRQAAGEMGKRAESVGTIGANPEGAYKLAQTATTWNQLAELCARLEALTDAVMLAVTREDPTDG